MGKLVVDIPISGSDTAHLNAVELVAVPEPATYGLLAGVCMLGLAVWRRR